MLRPGDTVEAVRRFNRFYTRRIGLLEDGFLRSPYSLSEVRVLYELAQQGTTTATRLGAELGLDAGYLSRMLRGLEERGLVEKRPSAEDRRQSLVSLSAAGERAFAELDAVQRREVEALLTPLSAGEQRRLVEAMRSIEGVMAPARPSRVPYVLRPPQSGDLGWVVHRHGVLYGREYGWNEKFEALVARIVADFVEHFEAARERCWIAEREGENVGSVFLVRHPEHEGVARLRLLLVEPEARGLGIGRRLVQECTRFARQARYRRITLWTNSVLHAARRIYEAEGYRLVGEEPHDRFGEKLVGQTWELEL